MHIIGRIERGADHLGALREGIGIGTKAGTDKDGMGTSLRAGVADMDPFGLLVVPSRMM